jgi:MFS transporter, DHA1 family, multidrug resistance protein
VDASASPSKPPLQTAKVSKRLIALLTAMVMVGQMSTSLYVPSLPFLADDLGVDTAEVKLTMTVFLIAFALSQLVYGSVSDRFGRRPVLLTGMVIYVVATLICAVAPNIEILILGRFLQGVGACAGTAIARAVVRDRFERREATRALAIIAMAMAVSPALGPIIGGNLQVYFGWQANFAALAIFGVLVLIAAAIGLAESIRQPDPTATQPSRMIANYRTLLSSSTYWGYMLVIGSCFAGLFAYMTSLPFVFIELLGFTPDLFGFVFIFTVIGYLMGSTTVSQIALHIDGDYLVLVGTTLMFAGGLVMVGFVLCEWVSAVTIVGPMAVFMFGFGITLPNATAGAISPFPHMAGVASAMLGFFQMAMAAVASIAVAFLYDETALPMAAVICATGILAVLSRLALIAPRLR